MAKNERRTTRIPKDFYESLFDNALDGVIYCQMLFDAQRHPVDFVFIRANKNFKKSKGLIDIAGKKITKLVPGIVASSPELFEICGRVSMSGKPERFETHFELLDQWFLVSVYSPKKSFFIAVFQNITDQKQIEESLNNAKIAARNVLEDLQVEKEKLAASNAKDEALLGSIGDGVIATNGKGIIILINKSAEKLLDRKGAELMGKVLSDAIPMQDEKGIPIPFGQRPMSMALGSGTTTTTTTTAGASYYYVRKDKTVFPAAITVTPVLLGKKVVGAIEVFRDITKEKEIDKAKTEFVSLASHQLRTPLSSVRWYADMLLDGDAGTINEKQRRYLEEVQHGNLRMIALVNLLLNVSRLELGTTKVTVESLPLSKVVMEVLKDMEDQRAKQDVSAEVHISDSLPPLLTDAKLVRIVIENLISNAIKYTKAHGTVNIVAQEVSAGEPFPSLQGGAEADTTRVASEKSIGFSVSDNGIGIPPEQQGRIFEKLFRTENAREIDTDGVGLGLYLSKLILQQLKGQIWFTSQIGRGTNFYVLLPVAGVK